MSSRRGPDLPYSVVAGVTPWGPNWLVASAKLHGAVFAPEEPSIFESFRSVIDYRPTYAVVVVNAPIGYLASRDLGVRACEREARELLGQRAMTVHNAPTRAALDGVVSWSDDQLDAISATLLPRYREVANEMSPYRQRMVYEGHPELSFYQLNGDQPLKRSKETEKGRKERKELLLAKVPGIQKVLDADLDQFHREHLLDTAALLWTARRVFAHAAKRVPYDPEWDGQGIRMEIVY